jgi:hypothetical protein
MHRLIGEAMVDLVVEVERTHLNPDQYMMMNITREGVEVMVMTIRAMVGSIFHRGTNQKILESIKHFNDDDEDGLAHVGTGLDKTYFGLLGFSGYHFPLYSSKLCVDHHTPCHILYTRRPKTGRERSLICPQSQILTWDAFGALYNTFTHRVAWLCAWFYTDLHSNTVLPS